MERVAREVFVKGEFPPGAATAYTYWAFLGTEQTMTGRYLIKG
jgi:hypothetical protein